jgi:hypothetical protein
MGVYIPNMSKPKDSCWECKAQYNSVCSLKREHIKFDGILDDCPLIEINAIEFDMLVNAYHRFKILNKIKVVKVEDITEGLNDKREE